MKTWVQMNIYTQILRQTDQFGANFRMKKWNENEKVR